MIVIKEFKNISFASKQEALKHLVVNYSEAFTSKMNTLKECDSFRMVYPNGNKKQASKAEGLPTDPNVMRLKFVANSCGILDSHGDVHIPKGWDSMKGVKGDLHLESHRRGFRDVIGDDTEWSIENVVINGMELECLVMTSIIRRDRNPYMFEQYEKNYVKQHSVGMYYINLYLCIDSEEKGYENYKDNYDKYIGFVKNKEAVDELGYFWAVTEAVAKECSAVTMGSNPLTPVISEEEKEEVIDMKHILEAISKGFN